MARFVRDEINQNHNWQNQDGRPKKDIEIFKYMSEHPNATKAEVIRETGLSKKTVYKYYDDFKRQFSDVQKIK